jgi:HPt (histidine-containing phosphotransfer) domain-containing protein
MAYDPGAIEATLAAAVGDEPGLIAELRQAFVDSARRAIVALDEANDAETWRAAAWRLKGLAASFGAVRLMALAMTAAEGPPLDGQAVRKLRRVIERL